MSLQSLLLLILNPAAFTPCIDPAILKQSHSVAADALRAAKVRKMKNVVPAPTAHQG